MTPLHPGCGGKLRVAACPVPGVIGQAVQAGAAAMAGYWPRDGVVPLLCDSFQQAPEPVTAEHPRRELPGIALADVVHHLHVELWVGFGLLHSANFGLAVRAGSRSTVPNGGASFALAAGVQPRLAVLEVLPRVDVEMVDGI